MKPNRMAAWHPRHWLQTRVLLLEHDAAGCRAAVAVRSGKGWQIGPLQQADGQTPAQVLASLQAQLGGNLPRQCLLLSMACLNALADLPVDPAKPRPAAQMLEMIRYEMEPLIAQHNNLWTLGEIMGAKGYLTPAQRREVAVALENRRLHERSQPYRYGEVALAEGLISREQLDDCLARQAELQLLDSELACGWIGAKDSPPEWPRWRIACCTAAWRDQWREALEQHRIRLLGVAPLPGSGFEQQAAASRRFIGIDIRPEQIVCALYQQGRLVQIQQEPRLEREVSADWLLDLLAAWPDEPGTDVGLMLADASAAGLEETLQTRLRAEIRLLAADAAAATGLRFAALLAERDAGRGGARLPLAPARAAAPPPWKSERGRLAIGAAVAVCAMLAWEGKARYQLAQVRKQHAELQRQVQAQTANPLQVMDSQARELEKQVAQRQQQLAAVLGETGRLDAIAARIETVPALIRLLGQTINPEVVLDALEEGVAPDADIGIRVQAWSPYDQAAQRFASDVQQAVRQIGLTVAQTDLQAAKGRTGSSGYSVSFWLIPQPPDDMGAAATQPAAAPAAQPAAQAAAQPAAAKPETGAKP